MAVGSAWGSHSLSRTVPAPAARSALQSVVAAPADGYTLLLVSTSAVISASYYKNLSFNIIARHRAGLRHFTGAAGHGGQSVCSGQNGAGVHRLRQGAIPARSSWRRSATARRRTSPAKMFKLMAKVDLLHVPYQGAAPALTDLLGGRADVMFEAMPTLVGYIRQRQVARRWGWAPRRARRCFPNFPP